MAKPQRRRKTAAKIATKREQNELVAKAEALAADPTPLIPLTEGKGKRAAAEKLGRRLKRVAAKGAKPGALRWAMRYGDPLARAFASMLLVGAQGGAPRMAAYPTPVGDLKYAYRGGNVNRRALVAVTHHQHPTVRILGYRHLAQKTGGLVWVTHDRVVLTGPKDAPPDAWWDIALADVEVPLEHRPDPTGGVLLTDGTPENAFGIQIRLPTGPLTIHLGESTIREHFSGKKTRGLLARLAQFLIGLEAHKVVQMKPTGTPRHCRHEGTPCLWEHTAPELSKKSKDSYQSGGMNEGRLLDLYQELWTEAVRKAEGRLFATHEHCYGDQPAGLLDAAGLTGDMRDAVRDLIDAGPDKVLLDEASPGKLVDAVWEAAPEVLARWLPDAAQRAQIIERHARSPKLHILEEVLAAARASRVLAGFPDYDGLGSGAATAHRIARAYKVGGNKEAVDTIDRILKQGCHKGVVWAALQHMDAVAGRDWQFDRNDRDAGDFLKGHIATLFDAEPDGYHAALGEVHTLSGGSGDLPKPMGA